jgi:hypothetical protein
VEHTETNTLTVGFEMNDPISLNAGSAYFAKWPGFANFTFSHASAQKSMCKMCHGSWEL